jgi:polyisoprenoid-binding protein YceI
MSRTIVVALLALLVSTPTVGAETWQIDASHSSVQFSIRHMTVSNVRGEFRTFSGSVEGDPKAPTAAKVEATIDAASLDTQQEKRDTHLKSPDFFDVAKYPTITFRSTKIEAAGEGKWRMTGDLTLHGVTKPVVLEVEGPTGVVKDPQGNTRAGARATGKINRKDFGITWSKTLDGGGLVVGDDVTITIDVEGVKKS